jgi:hypothetical protein
LAVDWYDGLGFGFRAGTALASVFNAGDELGLSDAPDSPYVRLTPI